MKKSSKLKKDVKTKKTTTLSGLRLQRQALLKSGKFKEAEAVFKQMKSFAKSGN